MNLKAIWKYIRIFIVTSNLKNSINIVFKITSKLKNFIQNWIKIPKLGLTFSLINSFLFSGLIAPPYWDQIQLLSGISIKDFLSTSISPWRDEHDMACSRFHSPGYSTTWYLHGFLLPVLCFHVFRKRIWKFIYVQDNYDH